MKNGFTLIELSIVLVVIGLLIGGILVGQSLIESAEINKSVRQIQQYDIAVNNFHEKFKQLPGDSNLFTYKGNNDGDLLDSVTGGVPACGVASCAEYMFFWRHLTDSGNLKGSYSSNFSSSLKNISVPEFRGLALVTWYNEYELGPQGPKGWHYQAENFSKTTNGAFIYAVDSKMDDRNVATGIVRGYSDNTLSDCPIQDSECQIIFAMMGTVGGSPTN